VSRAGERARHAPARALSALLLCAAGSSGQDAPRAPVEAFGASFSIAPDRAAEEALVRGDDALARSRAEATPAARARALLETCAAWQAALGESRAHGLVRVDPRSARPDALAEALPAALLRRLAALSPAERALWTERASPAAEPALRAALARPDLEGLLAALAHVEQRHAGTPAAARAALASGDLWRERGSLTLADGAYARARRHAGAHPGLELEAALARRARPDGPARASEAWESARSLEPWGALPLDAGPLTAAPRAPLAACRGVRPGLAFLDEPRAAIQTAAAVHVIGLGEREPRIEVSFVPERMIEETLGPLDACFAGNDAPGWPLRPAFDGERLLLVAGRVREGFANALLAIELPAPETDGQRRPRVPRLAWALLGDRWQDADGAVRQVPELAPFLPLELQPAPCLVDHLLLVQGRRIADEALEACVLAVERASGRLAWVRSIGQGLELGPERGRWLADAAGGLHAQAAAQPAVLAGAHVFLGTHLGAGACVDPDGGQVEWLVQNRRRALAERGWDGGAPPLLHELDTGWTVAWAPADGAELLRLCIGPLPPAALGPEAVLACDPVRGAAQVLVAAASDEVLVLGRPAAQRSLSALRSGGDDALDALDIGPSEHFRGQALCSSARVVFSTDRALYAFDRTREFYLLDAQPLARVGSVRGGDVFGRGQRVLVLGPDALWCFRARP
jgi:hypothetical protein